jgi:hypothetical protein
MRTIRSGLDNHEGATLAHLRKTRAASLARAVSFNEKSQLHDFLSHVYSFFYTHKLYNTFAKFLLYGTVLFFSLIPFFLPSLSSVHLPSQILSRFVSLLTHFYTLFCE